MNRVYIAYLASRKSFSLRHWTSGHNISSTWKKPFLQIQYHSAPSHHAYVPSQTSKQIDHTLDHHPSQQKSRHLDQRFCLSKTNTPIQHSTGSMSCVDWSGLFKGSRLVRMSPASWNSSPDGWSCRCDVHRPDRSERISPTFRWHTMASRRTERLLKRCLKGKGGTQRGGSWTLFLCKMVRKCGSN